MAEEEPKPRGKPVFCNTCYFYDTSVLNMTPGTGLCRGFVPIPPASIGQLSHWPVVTGNQDWCKEYLVNSATWP